VVGAALKHYAWPALAAVALSYLVALALTGERPGPGLAPFEARGLLRDVPLETVAAVELFAEAHAWRFERPQTGAWRVTLGAPLPALERDLTTALTLLRNSGPERTLTLSETTAASLAQFGLEKPRLKVAVRARSGQALIVAFGTANALASIRYARVGDSNEIVLLPSFVAEAWERLAGIP
jgi:hypothetical protein